MTNYLAESSVYTSCAEAEIYKEYGTCESALKSYIKKGSFKTDAESVGIVPATANGNEELPAAA